MVLGYKTLYRMILYVAGGIALSVALFMLSSHRHEQTVSDCELTRIICIAPGITECLFAMGCEERIVGVGDFSNYPESVQSKQRVGGYINPNLEVILALKPDLIIVQGNNEKVLDFCSFNGIRFERFEMDNLRDLFEGIARLGEVLSVSGAADALVKDIRAGLDSVAESVSDHERRTVFYSLGHNPGDMNTLFTAGKSGFLTELITIAGGRNIFDDNEMLYPEISKETLVMRGPEIIIESIAGKTVNSEYKEKLMDDWQGFPTIPAVRDGNVYISGVDYVEIPGPRIVMGAELLARFIHPEAFDGQ